jgi:Zn-dependent protease with chaperone function
MMRHPLIGAAAVVLMPVICLVLPDDLPLLELGVAGLPVLSALAVVARAVHLEAGTRRHLERLVTAEAPPALVASMARTAAGPVRFVVSSYPAAFCAAALQPAIHVTEGLVERLRPDELDAVLIHEQDHVRRREPLRRLIWNALAAVFFYVPLVPWWARHRAELAELAADRAAIARRGSAALAGAVWVVGSEGAPRGAVAFGDATEARVSQLLGQQLPKRRPGARLCVLSGGGLTLAAAFVVCMFQSEHVLVPAF